MRGTLFHFISTLTEHLLALVFGALDEEKPKKTLDFKIPTIWERKGEAGREGGASQKDRDSTRQPEVRSGKKK